jgi:peptidoglycan/LPS O-acetylase OafA/YrhL
MNKSFSLYLDAIRFSAAMVVFLSHTASSSLTDGFLWQFKDYSQTAVMVFFVLSGYVIAYVADNKEKTIQLYTISRISRLYTVVVPALLLTAILDGAGLYFDNGLYHNESWPYPEGSQLSHYVLSFFMLQNVWDLQLNPGINGPFWSLTFELIYYILFASYFYLKSPFKWLLILVVSMIAGPTILSLFPIWLLGVFLYYFKKQQASHVDEPVIDYRAMISFIPLLLLVFVSPIVRDIDITFNFISRSSLLGDYFDALMFGLYLLYIPYFLPIISGLLSRYTNLIRWLGSLTFALYLFHRPIIQVISAVYEGDISSMYYRVFMIVVTLLIIMTFGRWCENQKGVLKKYLTNLKAFNVK